MYAQVEKSKENKSRAVANSVTQKKSKINQGIGIIGNRYETNTQGWLKDTGRKNSDPNILQKKESIKTFEQVNLYKNKDCT